MKNSKIGWTDDTNNPIVRADGGFYCFKCSPGCTNCYAEGVNNRFFNETHQPYMNMKEFPELKLKRDMLAKWARMVKPRKIFVSSMTDVFGEFVPDEWVFEILDAMIAAPKQTFQVLTKRAKRCRILVNQYCDRRSIGQLPNNIWIIPSVEDQKRASERIPELMKTRCSVRGLSMEPLIEAVDLTKILYQTDGTGPVERREYLDVINGWDYSMVGDVRVFDDQCDKIDWVVAGGESGRNARPMHPDWVTKIKDQCVGSFIPFFFKQWGEYAVGSDFDNVHKRNHYCVLSNGDNDVYGSQVLINGNRS